MLATAYHAIILSPEDISATDAVAIEIVLQQPGWSAVLLHKNPIAILHNPTHSPARQQANLMYEFAHYLLNHPLAELTGTTEIISTPARYELEATYLGGCLQIPQRGLAWASQVGWNEEQIASHFGASLEMVRWRSNVTKTALTSCR